ncbi:hypothetical protein PR003_g14358 [Phytophthora rubi]|uniref:Uncharacterized protein n=1 Tax=Phytophthora rubi TaxID=129364 RepID=A0A6A3L816_9STRA|nr:hypothetical protein PR002_g14248 [Phytophthora rubi]KAE9332753.1 hypothetical protein PR003_g14358 [Phytophthora rubi]
MSPLPVVVLWCQTAAQARPVCITCNTQYPFMYACIVPICFTSYGVFTALYGVF